MNCLNTISENDAEDFFGYEQKRGSGAHLFQCEPLLKTFTEQGLQPDQCQGKPGEQRQQYGKD